MKEKDKDKIGKILLRVWLPSKIKQAFKAKCSKDGRLMSSVILQLMQGYVEGEEK